MNQTKQRQAKVVQQDRFFAKQNIKRIEKRIRIREKLKFAEKKRQNDDRPLLERLEAVTADKVAKNRKRRDEISDMLFLDGT